MEKYSELFYQARSNNKKLKNIDKYRRERTFYNNEPLKDRTNFSYQNIDAYENDSFSIRMIAVMLVLVAVMFLKQTGILNENQAYQTVMAEIHRQVSTEEIESAVTDRAIYPVMNWINDQKNGQSY